MVFYMPDTISPPCLRVIQAMLVNGLFGEPDEMHEIQTGLGLDDGARLRVVSASFLEGV